MRGLTELERRTLEPVGRPGERTTSECLAQLCRDGRGRWTGSETNPTGVDFEPTELGLLALRVCPRE